MAVQELAFIFPTIIKIENMSMNFTKHYLGIKILVVTVVFGTIIILVSCNKEEDIYHVTPAVGSVLNGIMILLFMVLFIKGAI